MSRIGSITTLLVGSCLCGLGQTESEYRTVTQNFETYLQTHLSTDSMFEALSDMGFNRVVLEPHQMHALANSHGLSVLLANWWNVDTDTSTMHSVFSTALNVDDLAGINMADEPFLNGIWNPVNGQHSYPASLYEGILPDFRAQYPGVKLGFSLFGPWFHINQTHDYDATQTYRMVLEPYYELIDMVKIMPYTYLYGLHSREMIVMIEQARLMVQLVDREVDISVVLQTWSTSDNTNPNFPSIAELRAQSFATVMTGADALSFFTFNPEVYDKIPGFSQAFADMITEVSDFATAREDFNVSYWLDNGKTYLSAHVVSKYLPRQDYCVLVNLGGTSIATHNLTPYEVRILDGVDCPWTLPPDSLLNFTSIKPIAAVGGTLNGVEAFPNPANGVLNIKCSSSIWETDGLTLKIVDIHGREMARTTDPNAVLNGRTVQMDVSNYPPVVYFLQLTSDIGSYNELVVVR